MLDSLFPFLQWLVVVPVKIRRDLVLVNRNQEIEETTKDTNVETTGEALFLVIIWVWI
jgi:hypothetical protein